jgi:toxin FitB
MFVDTSVVIPLFYGDHQHHEASRRVIDQLQEGEGFCGSHSLVETYSALTRMPGKYRVSAERARLFLISVSNRLKAIALTAEEYSEMLDHGAARGITGGGIYDMILARCAVKINAEALLTWNFAHFARFGPELAHLVKTPLEFLQPK